MRITSKEFVPSTSRFEALPLHVKEKSRVGWKKSGPRFLFLCERLFPGRVLILLLIPGVLCSRGRSVV